MSDTFPVEIWDFASKSQETRRVALDRLRSLNSIVAIRAIAGRLGDDSADIRETATESLIDCEHPAAGDMLVQLLRCNHSDPVIMLGLIKVLTRTRLDVTLGLTQLLLDSDELNLRAHSALILGLRGDKTGIPALELALLDRNNEIRLQAIRALARLKAGSAVPTLTSIACGDDPTLAAAAIIACTDIGHTLPRSALMCLMQRPELLPVILPSLVRTGNISAIPVLAELLSHRQDLISNTVSAIVRIARRHPDASAVLPDFIDEAKRMSLASYASNASWHELPDLTVLCSFLGGDVIARALATVLARCASRGITPHTASAHASERLEIGIAAANALNRIDQARAVDAIGDAITSGPSQFAVHMIAKLQEIGGMPATEVLWAHIINADPDIRDAAISALIELDTLDIERIQTLLKDPDPILRSMGLALLKAQGENWQIVMQAMKDPEPRVRCIATMRLPDFLDTRASEPLIKMLDDPVTAVRMAATHAIGKLDEAGVVEGFSVARKDDNPWVRYFAVRSIARRVNIPCEQVIAIALYDDTPLVRIAAIDTLSASPSLQVERALRSLSRDRDRRLSAIATRTLEAMDIRRPRK
jgi:HEAT repeat protein